MEAWYDSVRAAPASVRAVVLHDGLPEELVARHAALGKVDFAEVNMSRPAPGDRRSQRGARAGERRIVEQVEVCCVRTDVVT